MLDKVPSGETVKRVAADPKAGGLPIGI